ncbi:hypothetical protein DLAC_03155 [Tieghemostelium lacteum]|uniref:N-acetyltransferase domain-containing protein n=1 Tax=Tieghemostelium lacteum TaxID=361077 RepID=A0A152A2H1_TIELA|nr:hypothetical protein DLAC_03155 [Tieghemostelium lacteum]|eukprot:KYR00404.1 hypothetical protein DLAC_03155 [Tieghemostelium lacteum]
MEPNHIEAKTNIIILENDRIRMKQLEENEIDAEFMIKLVNDEAWLEYIGDRNVKTIEQSLAYIRRGKAAQISIGNFIVYDKITNEPMGCTGLFKRDFLDQEDLGFAFLRKYHGKGYAYDSCQLILNHCKETLKYKYLYGITSESNQGSIKLLKKLGMTYTKQIQDPLHAQDSSKHISLFTLNLC